MCSITTREANLANDHRASRTRYRCLYKGGGWGVFMCMYLLVREERGVASYYLLRVVFVASYYLSWIVFIAGYYLSRVFFVTKLN